MKNKKTRSRMKEFWTEAKQAGFNNLGAYKDFKSLSPNKPADLGFQELNFKRWAYCPHCGKELK